MQQPLNALLLIGAVAASVVIGINATPGGGVSQWWIVAVLVLAGVLGLTVVLPIGGADMPVVISLLNALTGLSAAAAGLALNNTAMIVAGMIVGASGTILTNLMAKAMNRSIPAIVAGGFGGGDAAAGPAGAGGGTAKATSAADAAIQMAYANQVIVVPGYGLAVAQAQHAVKDMAKLLESKGVEVKYAIHPVAGRMPGHMNVLLAEADVAYDAMKEMDDINDEFARTDVTLVIGANDVTKKFSIAASAARLGDAVERLTAKGCVVAVGTCPDLGVVTAIPQPLRTVVRNWGRRLAHAQTARTLSAGGHPVALADLLSPRVSRGTRHHVLGGPLPSVGRWLRARGAADSAGARIGAGGVARRPAT